MRQSAAEITDENPAWNLHLINSYSMIGSRKSRKYRPRHSSSLLTTQIITASYFSFLITCSRKCFLNIKRSAAFCFARRCRLITYPPGVLQSRKIWITKRCMIVRRRYGIRMRDRPIARGHAVPRNRFVLRRRHDLFVIARPPASRFAEF